MWIRADVYSLGVVLHELLTGSLPFKTTDPDVTPAELVRELLTHDPAAPSTRLRREDPPSQESAANRGTTPRQLAARLAGDLDWIVLKALERDRNRRYNSPSELAADIRRHLANEPVIAGPPSTLYRMRKFAARHRLVLSLIAGNFLAAIAFGAVMAYQAHELAKQRDEARFQAQRAEASNEFMSLMLEEVGPGGRPLSPVELVDRGVELLELQYGGDQRFAARMLMQMSNRYMDLGRTEKAAEVLRRANAIARGLQDDELTAASECALVGVTLDATAYEEAERHMAAAQEALVRIGKLPLEIEVNCVRARADIDQATNREDVGIPHLLRARELLERAGAVRGLQYNSVLNDLGIRYFGTGRLREALDINQQAIEVLDRNGRGGTMGRHTLSINRASILYWLGEVQQAAEALRRLEELRREEPVAPASALIYALTLNRLERTSEAMALLETTAQQARELGNGYIAELADYYFTRSLMLAGRFDEAAPRFEALRQEWANRTAVRNRFADLTATMADLALRRGNVPQARELIAESLQAFGWPTDKKPLGLNSALVVAARIHLATGEHALAREYATAALRMAESTARDSRQSADVGEALLAWAAAHGSTSSRAEVQAAFRRAVESLTNALGADHRLTREAQTAMRKEI